MTDDAEDRDRRRGDDVVELRLPADGAYLSVLRTATAGLAARLDFTLDEIEDLRIAVDEACALLLPDAVPGRAADLRVRAADRRARGHRDGAEPDRPALPRRDTFAWTVLTALAGEVDAAVADDGTVSVTLRKRARARRQRDAASTTAADELDAAATGRPPASCSTSCTRSPTDDPQPAALRDELVELHLPLVEYLARRFPAAASRWTTSSRSARSA